MVFLHKMPKEILFYNYIYGYTADQAMKELSAVGNSDLSCRFNGDGGEVRYAWGVLTKLKEIKGKKVFKNDGEANSMYAFAFCYNDNNEATDVATFCFHRASYGDWYENESGLMTETQRQELVDKNAKLRLAMEAKLNVPMFEKITGTTLNALFSMDSRIDVTLTAKQAFDCGLINRIVELTPELSNEIQAYSQSVITAFGNKLKIAAHADNSNKTTMTVEELKSKHPETYKAIFAKGVKRGIEKEYERAEILFGFAETSPEKALQAFKSKAPISAAQNNEFLMAQIQKAAVKTIEGESAGAVTTIAANEKPGATGKAAEDAKAKAEFEAAMNKQMEKFKKSAK